MDCDNWVGGGECDPCRASSKTKSKRLNWNRVSNYKFDPLVHRLVDKEGWSKKAATEGFEDIKKFLYLCVLNRKPLTPPPRLDHVWHQWILFTEDYARFCRRFFGKFIHHRPYRRGEKPDKNMSISKTIALAEKRFGLVSLNWKFGSGARRKLKARTAKNDYNPCR